MGCYLMHAINVRPVHKVDKTVDALACMHEFVAEEMISRGIKERVVSQGRLKVSQ